MKGINILMTGKNMMSENMQTHLNFKVPFVYQGLERTCRHRRPTVSACAPCNLLREKGLTKDKAKNSLRKFYISDGTEFQNTN